MTHIRLLATLIILTPMLYLPSVAQINNSYHDTSTKLTFPKKLGDFSRAKLKRYDEGLGYSVAYGRSNTTVTIYVYTAGSSSIENGIDDINTIETFKSAKKDILTLKSRGLYKDLTVVKTGVSTLSEKSEHPFLSLELDITLPGKTESTDLKVFSRLLVTGFRNHFIKIRSTGPTSDDPKALAEMLSEFSALLKIHI